MGFAWSRAGRRRRPFLRPPAATWLVGGREQGKGWGRRRRCSREGRRDEARRRGERKGTELGKKTHEGSARRRLAQGGQWRRGWESGEEASGPGGPQFHPLQRGEASYWRSSVLVLVQYRGIGVPIPNINTKDIQTAEFKKPDSNSQFQAPMSTPVLKSWVRPCSQFANFATPGTSIAAGVLSLLLVVMTCLYVRKRRQYKMTSSSRLLKPTASGGTPRSRGSTDKESGSVHSLQTHHFTYEELEEATDSFSGTMEIGDGGFGTVYKGHLRDGRVVAVKRLYNNSFRRVEQFLNEAAILSRLRHPNLVLFYGCTSSRSRELLLVYEFVPNGTVADHLHGHRAAERALTWPLRLSVAVEAAAALAYLHAVEPPVMHRDVKTTNFLLDADFHVKVADFGLSRLFPVDVTHVSTAPQGTPGYVDPEYHQCYQLTDRSDVYSFGVVLVELISSKPAVDVTRDRSEINLAGMAISKIQQCQLEQLVDLDLGYGSDEATTKAMTMVAELAFRCLQQNGEMRPPIKEVLDALRSIQDDDGFGKKGDALVAPPRSPDTVHAPWDSMSTTPSISQ